MKNAKKSAYAELEIRHRQRMYNFEVWEWLKANPNATPTEIDEMYRRMARKWRV